MKRLCRVIVTAAAAVGLVHLWGCSNASLYELASRTSQEPVIATPTADSFAVEEEIHLSWSEDPGADEYVLLRDVNFNGSYDAVVYDGIGTSFADTNVTADDTYYYRLAKRRGQRRFEPSGPVFAVGSAVRKDEHEPNDSSETAVPFEDGMACNIFAFRDGFGNSLIDVDYYSITVPADSRAVLEFVDFANLAADELVVQVIRDGVEFPLTDGQELSIDNDELEQRTLVFRVYVDTGEFFGSGGSGAGGGAVAAYQIDLIRTEPL